MIVNLFSYISLLITYFIKFIIIYSYGPANAVCGPAGQTLMCPLCDVSSGCGPWYLNSTCTFVRISYLFDHGGTVFYAVFMSFWSVCFLENWKRKQVGIKTILSVRPVFLCLSV